MVRKTLPNPRERDHGSPREPSDRPTMLDVAALAGVGLTTVSRVVNDKPGVSPATAARVRAAIEQLDYRHDMHASILRRSNRKTATIGLVLEDVANPFMSALHRAVEDSARERGMLVFAGSCDEDGGREREFIGALRARRVDGMIVVPAGPDHSYLLPELRVGTPIVFVDRPPRFLDADSVTADDRGGTSMAVSHLVARGHERIGYLGADQVIVTAEERFRGYRDGLAAHGLDVDPAIVRLGLSSVEDAERGATEILADRRRPTAVLSGQNYFTVGAYKALRGLGLLRRVALVGFDDFPLAELLDPAVTVIAHDPGELGLNAAKLLFRRLDGDRSPSEHVVCAVNLVQRGSGEISAAFG